MYDPNAGTLRTNELPGWWPAEGGEHLKPGMALVGYVEDIGSWTPKATAQEPHPAPVGTLCMIKCVGIVPAGEGYKAYVLGERTVSISKGLVRPLKQGKREANVGRYLQIVYEGEDERFNNMKCYRVSEVQREYVAELHREAVPLADGIAAAGGQ